MKNTQLTNLAVNTEADALAVLANSGILRIYDGAQPASGDTPITTQTLLAELVMNATAFAAAVAGVISANAIAPDTDANATGTASWFRLFKADGITALWDGAVGDVSDAPVNLQLNSKAIQLHAQVSVATFSHTIAKSTAGS